MRLPNLIVGEKYAIPTSLESGEWMIQTYIGNIGNKCFFAGENSDLARAREAWVNTTGEFWVKRSDYWELVHLEDGYEAGVERKSYNCHDYDIYPKHCLPPDVLEFAIANYGK